MTNSPSLRGLIVQAALEIAPPMIRASILEDSGFREEFHLKPDAVLILTEAGIEFLRSRLYDAARKALSGEVSVEVSDTKGAQWALTNGAETGKLPELILVRNDQHLILPDLTALAADKTLRLRDLDVAALDVNLPRDAYGRWHSILTKHPLADEELDEYHSDFRDTAVAKVRLIKDAIMHGQDISIPTLVPTSRRYFERLVGVYDGSTSPREYANQAGRAHLAQLHEWHSYEGLLFALLLSSHRSIVAQTPVDQISTENLLRAFDFLEKHGDRISQVGMIELGLRVLAVRPEIALGLTRLIQQVRDDDTAAKTSGFQLLSGLFFLVDGELSQARLFPSEPPFYRRLAALAHAALIQRQLVRAVPDAEHFTRWALENRGEQYYMQSFTDMRPEPRWNPDYASPAQLKADCLGRIMSAAQQHENDLKGNEIWGLVFGDGPQSIRSMSANILSYLPGALEGGEDAQVEVPTDISDTIRTQLATKEPTPASFTALVNSALIFRLANDEAELATKALKLGNYRLSKVDSEQQLLAILDGLGTVAAITRNTDLADDLRILVRRYRGNAEYRVTANESMRVCLIAAASRADITSWRDFVGDWLTELAFSELDWQDGATLYSHLQCLLRADPGLWRTCGRASTVVLAYGQSVHKPSQ